MKIKNLIHAIRIQLNNKNPDYKELALMGAWGNYIARHFLRDDPLKQIRISKEERRLLIKKAENYEKICVTAFTKCIKN